ncbi:MAG: hypothetical protein R3D71_04225 [Rickettsiales bacterium]
MPTNATNNEKQKHIVVFAANGGIGADVIGLLSDQVEQGKNYKISIVTRKGEEYNQARILELMEGEVSEAKRNLFDALMHDGHTSFDNKNDGALRDILKDADMVISPGGKPRPNPPPPRSALIYPNSKVVEPIVDAMARYAPKDTPLLLATNPLDNMVQLANDRFKQKWKEFGKEQHEGELPEVKAIGMAGALDERRLKIYTAIILRKVLKENGAKPGNLVLPSEIDGRVYGQHGEKMAVDIESIKIQDRKTEKWESLDNFLEKNGIKDKKVNVKIKGEEQSLSIKEAIEAETIDGGAKVIRGQGRSSQRSPAKRIVEMVNDYFSDEKKVITASVVKDGIASGNPVIMGGGKLEIGNMPKHITEQSKIGEKIVDARQQIKTDHETYNKALAAEKVLLPILKDVVVITASESKEGMNVTIKAKDDSNLAIAANNVEDVRNALASIMGADSDNIDVENVTTSKPKITFSMDPKNKLSLDTFAEELGTSVSRPKTKEGSSAGKMDEVPTPSPIIVSTNIAAARAKRDGAQGRIM